MSFNQKLLSLIAVIITVVTVRLFLTAAETDNWRGLIISAVHLVIVALGTWLALRIKSTRDPA